MSGIARTTVIHVRDMQRGDVYVGRAVSSRGLKASPLANPFQIGRDGTREEVIEKYRARLRNRPDLVEAAKALAGKRIACWCKPDHGCHGDIVRAVADGEEW